MNLKVKKTKQRNIKVKFNKFNIYIKVILMRILKIFFLLKKKNKLPLLLL